jgi:hypothetical protein
MQNGSSLQLRLLFGCALLLFAVVGGRCVANGAASCPTVADEIATDRPDVTNSSLVVPVGSLQAENGVDWNVQHGSNAMDGTNSRLRFGVAPCIEFLIDVPDYFASLNGPSSSGFSNVIVSFKRQLAVPFGFNLSAAGGMGFPSGSNIPRPGYQPYIQFPWSHRITNGWSVEGMFTVIWLPSDSSRNPTFEPTLSVEREMGPSADIFIEYVGDYYHHRPAQLLDGGGAWRFSKTQQLDFHLGFGLNSSTVDHYFGIGYSFRLDGLFGAQPSNSP